MRKILLIIITIMISFIGIISLKAQEYKFNGGSIHGYKNTGLGNWVTYNDCADTQICSLDIPSGGIISFLYKPDTKLTLDKNTVYNLTFSFGLYTSSGTLSAPALEVTNVYIITTGEDKNSTEILNYTQSGTDYSVTIDVTFKTLEKANFLYIAVDLASIYSNSNQDIGFNQTIKININQDFTISTKLDDLNKTQQETNNKLDNIDNTMKDDDVDTDSATNFFDDFNNTDHGGLSTIITAPLNALVKITETCEPITIPVLDKNIELPCGDTLFWNKPEVQTFRAIWNVIVGGPILYMLLVKLFKIIEGLKNPDDDRIEVCDL